MQLASVRPGQPAGSPGEPLAKRSLLWIESAGKAPDLHVDRGERRQLSDVGDREAEPVVRCGAHGDRDRDRDVQGRHVELDQGGLVGLGDEPVQRCGAEQARVVGDGDQPELRVRRALVEGEIRRCALRDRVDVAEQALWRVEDDVFRRLGGTGVFQRECGVQVGVPPCLRVRATALRVAHRRRERFDLLARGRRGGPGQR